MSKGVYKGRQIVANGSVTPGLTHLQGIIISSFNAAKTTFSISETDTIAPIGSSVTMDVPAEAGIVPIEFECPGMRFMGVSVSVPTSVTLFLIFEPGA